MLGIRVLGFWERLVGGLRKAQTEFSLTPSYHETAREKAGASSWFPPDLKFLWGKMWECAMKSFHLGVKERVGFLRKTSSVCPASCLYILLCMWVLSFSNSWKAKPSTYSFFPDCLCHSQSFASHLNFRVSLSVCAHTHTYTHTALRNLVWGKLTPFCPGLVAPRLWV